MPKTGLQEFKEVISDFKSVTSLAVGGAVAAPLVDFVLKLGPPWPPGVPIITSIVELLVLISIFHYWFKTNQKQLGKRMVIALIVLFISFAAYFILSSTHIYSVPTTNERYVKGFVLRPDVAPMINDSYTTDDALDDTEYNASEVWTGSSIAIMRMTILLLWLMMFISLSFFIGTFVISQRRKVIKDKAKDKAEA